MVVLCTTKYALPRQIKRKQRNSSIVLTFVGCEEINCYRGNVVSAGQLDATTARTNHYFAVFFLFLSWEV